MYFVRLFILLLFASVSTAGAYDQAITDLQQVNNLLQAEYNLAKAGYPYLLIELQENRLYLKASGLTLESWGIDSFRSWGRFDNPTAANLILKTSFAEPERNILVVDGQPFVAKPFNALELADMPTSYRLFLENGTRISVNSTPDGWLSHVRRTVYALVWYMARPLISNWYYLRGKPYNELALSLPEQDARMLYWAFSEGMPCLIRFPATAPVKAP